jgi:hypothetical protein
MEGFRQKLLRVSVELTTRRSLLGRLGWRNEIAGNLTNEIEKLLTGFDFHRQPQPRLFQRAEVIADFLGSRLTSYFGTTPCMLAASIWVSWHLHSLECEESLGTSGNRGSPGMPSTSSEPPIDSVPDRASQ